MNMNPYAQGNKGFPNFNEIIPSNKPVPNKYSGKGPQSFGAVEIESKEKKLPKNYKKNGDHKKIEQLKTPEPKNMNDLKSPEKTISSLDAYMQLCKQYEMKDKK